MKTTILVKLKNRTHFFLLLGFLLMSFSAIQAQQSKTIQGVVTDANGTPIPGVTIVEQGTTNGTQTDIDGKYTLKDVQVGSVISMSYIGYQTQDFTVSSTSTIISATMEELTEMLNEVVVIGYGTVKKSDLTGSVGSIDSEELNTTNGLRLDQAMKGKVAGLQVIPTSSDPGAETSIRIRGSNSISANNEPLYVVDGFIGGFSLNDINMSNVESIEVLKDASATAIYGSRGSNGVILITTKRGAEGKTKISFDSYISFQSPSRYIPVLNATEFAAFQNEVKGSNFYPESNYGEGTNWAKEVYRENVPLTSYNLSMTGGDANHKYFMSGNIFDQEGISINSELKRYNFQINSDHQISDKLKIGNSLIISRRTYTPGSFGTEIKNVIGWDPTVPVYDEEGNYTQQTQLAELGNDNPVANAELPIDITTTNKIIGSLYGEFEILEGLTYKLNLGANMQNGLRERYEPSTLYNQQNYQGTATINNNQSLDFLVENTLNYTRNFGIHSISALVGYTRQTINSKSSLVQARGFVSDAFSFNNLGAAAERSDANSNVTDSGLESYIFRANYGLSDKYLFTVSARLDGASVFAANNKWGLFPSAAVAWKAGQEDFIKNLNFFDDLKVRVSYGKLGNPGLNPGASLTKLAPGGNNYIFGTDQHLITGIAANTLGNPDLKWESTTQLDVGIDFSFFRNRLQLTADYYSKETEDLLVDVPLLWVSGFESVLTNYGTVSNKGFEFSLTSTNIHANEFKWVTNFNVSTNKNRVEDIIAPEGFILNNDFTWSGASGIIKEGESIGTFYGLEMDGIWNTQDEIDASGVSGFSVFPGGKRYKDIDGDKVINGTLDRTIIGHADPDFFGGISNRLTYKAFDLYVYFSFVVGNDIYNETGRLLEQSLDNNVYRKFVNRWTPTNTDTDIPSAEGTTRPYNVSNSGFVEDGSFLRLQNIRLSYNIPVANVKWLQTAQVYVAGDNILLFDRYSGYDPEISRGTSNTKRGYDHSQDPTLKSYSIGIKLDF